MMSKRHVQTPKVDYVTIPVLPIDPEAERIVENLIVRQSKPISKKPIKKKNDL